MSLRGTASGRLFAAYLPREPVLAALAAERADGPHAAGRAGAAGTAIDAAFRRQLEQVRRHGLSHTVDGAVPGVSALAAPVFDESGHIVLSLTAIGRARSSTRATPARSPPRSGAAPRSCRASSARRPRPEGPRQRLAADAGGMAGAAPVVSLRLSQPPSSAATSKVADTVARTALMVTPSSPRQTGNASG